MSHKVLVPVADGSEDIETVTLVDVLRRAGADVTLASVAPDNRLEITASRGIRMIADRPINECLQHEWDLVVLPGGMPGAENLRDCPVLVELLQQQKQAGRLYGAICAAPQVVLAHHGLLNDCEATGHPGFRNSIPQASNARVVRDGICMTSQAPGTALEFALALVEALFGREKRDEVAGPMVV